MPQPDIPRKFPDITFGLSWFSPPRAESFFFPKTSWDLTGVLCTKEHHSSPLAGWAEPLLHLRGRRSRSTWERCRWPGPNMGDSTLLYDGGLSGEHWVSDPEMGYPGHPIFRQTQRWDSVKMCFMPWALWFNWSSWSIASSWKGKNSLDATSRIYMQILWVDENPLLKSSISQQGLLNFTAQNCPFWIIFQKRNI